MRFISHAILTALVFTWALTAQAAPKVVATISPLHSLTAGVMVGVGTPKLLLPPGASPHGYALKPSDARALAEADIVVWVGEGLEQFLTKPLATLAAKARQVELAEAPGLTALKFRAGDAWASHDEDTHESDRGHEAAHHHDHTGVDPHIWLDPQNAQRMVEAIAAALIHADPENAERYEINAETLRSRLAALDHDLATKLQAVATRPFIVFHDSYQYLERRYRLTSLGTVTASPQFQPGARRISELRKRLESANGACLFTEPQFSPALARTLAHETGAHLATLDPLGADIEPGPNAYFIMMTRLGDHLHDCLAALP